MNSYNGLIESNLSDSSSSELDNQSFDSMETENNTDIGSTIIEEKEIPKKSEFSNCEEIDFEKPLGYDIEISLQKKNPIQL